MVEKGEERVAELEVAAGCEGLECRYEDGARVLEACHDCAHVDKVEGRGEVPLILGVADFELEVGRCAGRENWSNDAWAGKGGDTDCAGWMGDRSVPRTLLSGCA